MNKLRDLLHHDPAAALKAARSLDASLEVPTAETAFVMGAALQALKREQEAEASLGEALRRNPAHRHAGIALAHLQRNQGRYRAAAATVEALVTALPGDRRFALHAIGFLRDTPLPDEAEHLWLSTQQGADADSEAIYMGGEIALISGDFATARARFDRCLSLDPVNPGAIHGRAIAGSLSPDDGFAKHLASLARVCQRLPNDSRIMLEFALGKLAMDCGDLPTAFGHFDRANAARRAQMTWNRSEPTLSAHWPAADRPQSSRGDAVVLVLGMPRSGTTLLATRLGQHPGIAERGELPWLGMLEASEITANDYLHHLRQDDSPRARYIDKNPLNFRHLDLVAQEFPRARVLHCRRDPRDTAVSCYAQYFAHADMAWSSSWPDILEFQRRYREAIARRPSDIAWLDIDYAELVASPETVMRRALGFLGLDWDESVLATPERGSIGTASIWQARQPMHTRSLGRWRDAAPFIKPVLDAYGVGSEPTGLPP